MPVAAAQQAKLFRKDFDDLFRIDDGPILFSEEENHIEILRRPELAGLIKEVFRAI